MANGPELAAIFVFTGSLDLDIKRSRAQAWSDTDALGGQADVLGNLRRPEMRSFLVKGDIHLAEFQLRDGPQGLFERITGETKRGTCDVHGCLPAWIEDDMKRFFRLQGAMLITGMALQDKSIRPLRIAGAENLGILGSI